MKPSLYTSAMRGDDRDVADLEQHKDVLDGEVTPNNNTVLHVAAQFGSVNYVKEVLDACPSLLRRTNFKGETPLHIAARDGRAEIVKAMIDRAKRLEEELESGLVGAVKEILRATNLDGDTALHMAARNCHLEEAKYLKAVESLTKGLDYLGLGEEEVKKKMLAKTFERMKKIAREPKVKVDGEQAQEEIKSIIKNCREELEEITRATKELATNVDRDIAVHMAARNRLEKENRDYLEVVKLLSQEDAEFQHPPNNFQETPLYLAAESGIMGVAIVETLVETYKSLLTYSGPGGRTALHAAALHDSTGQSTKKLKYWKKDLINQADAYGWTPLHYAACNGNKKGVKELLAMDESGAYITTTNKDDQDTALHIAAAHGHESVIEELLHNAPDCWEMVNSKGQNVLHIAVDMNSGSVIKFILGKSWVRQLINQKDDDGNTPLHLLIASDCRIHELWTHDRADHHAFNGKNMTPVDLVWSNFVKERMSTFAATSIMDDTFLDSGMCGGRNLAGKALEKARRHEKHERKMRKEAEEQSKQEAENRDAVDHSRNLFQTYVVVGALIATITFAAAFTIPGGYDGNQGLDQGMAILARAAAFKAFVITNTIAMVCSVTSIFLCLCAMLCSLWVPKKKAVLHYGKRYFAALALIIVSMFFLMIAFIGATFAVFTHAIALAVSTCIIACIPIIAYILEFIKFVHFIKQQYFNQMGLVPLARALLSH